MRIFPPSGDVASLRVVDGKVVVHCEICLVDAGKPAVFLNQAIGLWYEHGDLTGELVDHGAALACPLPCGFQAVVLADPLPARATLLAAQYTEIGQHLRQDHLLAAS